jgi:hypothetical protein
MHRRKEITTLAAVEVGEMETKDKPTNNVLATRSGQPPIPATHFLEMAGLARSDSDRLSPLQLLLKAISIK